MRFTKKFIWGLLQTFVGLLTAFDNVGDYRTLPIVLFWAGMLAAFCGIVMMFKGIESVKSSGG
jgi:hypothetical protein